MFLGGPMREVVWSRIGSRIPELQKKPKIDMNLKEIGEFGFIRRIAPLGDIRSEGVIKGIGDDCAVIALEGDRCQLVTTDLLVERVHFLLEWSSPEVLGAKSLAVNLSDIAACGGTPQDAFISVAVPDRIEVEWLEAFYRGMADHAQRFGVNLLGGDTTGSRSDLVINVAVTGIVSRNEVLCRHTARAGDAIVITGPLGESGAGLHMLLQPVDIPPEVKTPLVKAHLEPQPHVNEGRFLASSGACTAAIDVSDGLSSDLWHLCEDSGIGAVIYEDKLPVSEELSRAGEVTGTDPLHWVLNGGEDYVLLAAIKPDMLQGLQSQARENGIILQEIGRFVEGDRMELVRTDGSRHDISAGGWDHFE